MKIIFIGFRLEPGLKEAIRNKTFFISRQLIKDKNKVIIITNGDKDKHVNFKGIKIHVCGCGTRNSVFWKNRNQFIEFATQILIKEQPDIIHDVFDLACGLVSGVHYKEMGFPLIRPSGTHALTACHSAPIR